MPSPKEQQTVARAREQMVNLRGHVRTPQMARSTVKQSFNLPLGIQSWIKDGSRLVLHLAVRTEDKKGICGETWGSFTETSGGRETDLALSPPERYNESLPLTGFSLHLLPTTPPFFFPQLS